MIEINVNVTSPDIVQAISLLVGAFRDAKIPDAQAAAPAVPVVPVAQAPIAQSLTAAAPVVQAPVAAAPSYTVAQVAKAGADLMAANPDLQSALVELIHKYGAQTVQEIPQDKLGTFATELRQMGAKI